MPRINTRYAVVVGTITSSTITNSFVLRRYTVSYMGAILPASWHGMESLIKGDLVVVDRRIPSLELTILGRSFGDSTEGTPYDGTGGVIQPRDAPGAGSAGTPPVMTGGFFTFDIGPGFSNGHLSP